MILFGWGRRVVKDIGPLFFDTCGRCNNEVYFRLLQITTWFTLFFIPIFPYSVENLIVCPTCQCTAKFPKEQMKDAKVLALRNKAAIEAEQQHQATPSS